MRDKSTCPSFKNLNKFPPKKLANMLLRALKGQLEELQKVPNYDKILERSLGEFIKRIRKAYKKYLADNE